MTDNLTRETFEAANPHVQRLMLWDKMDGVCVKVKRLECRRWFDKGIAAVSGFLGGAAAIFFKSDGG